MPFNSNDVNLTDDKTFTLYLTTQQTSNTEYEHRVKPTGTLIVFYMYIYHTQLAGNITIWRYSQKIATRTRTLICKVLPINLAHRPQIQIQFQNLPYLENKGHCTANIPKFNMTTQPAIMILRWKWYPKSYPKHCYYYKKQNSKCKRTISIKKLHYLSD